MTLPRWHALPTRLACFDVLGMADRYTALLDRLDTVPMAELVMAIRRTSPGFTRGSSSFRGVTQHKSGARLPSPASHSRLGSTASHVSHDACFYQSGAMIMQLVAYCMLYLLLIKLHRPKSCASGQACRS